MTQPKALGPLLCLLLAGLPTAMLTGCADEAPAELSQPARRGFHEYRAYCRSCHGDDPHRDGYNGPAIAGASAELLRAKVLRGVYPDGYRPKRATGVMPKQPHLAARIDDLAAYLAEARPRP